MFLMNGSGGILSPFQIRMGHSNLPWEKSCGFFVCLLALFWVLSTWLNPGSGKVKGGHKPCQGLNLGHLCARQVLYPFKVYLV